VFNRIGKMDPVTYGLELLAVRYKLNVDVQFWSQQLSFILVGALIVGSIRGLLIQFMKVRQNELS